MSTGYFSQELEEHVCYSSEVRQYEGLGSCQRALVRKGMVMRRAPAVRRAAAGSAMSRQELMLADWFSWRNVSSTGCLPFPFCPPSAASAAAARRLLHPHNSQHLDHLPCLMAAGVLGAGRLVIGNENSNKLPPSTLARLSSHARMHVLLEIVACCAARREASDEERSLVAQDPTSHTIRVIMCRHVLAHPLSILLH